MDNKKYILVAGYGWTGSSALVDMLKEYKGTIEADVEFRLIKDPKGISDLYNAIINKWDALNVDIAIRDFKWFVHHLNAPKKKLSLYTGLGYQNFFGDNFLTASNEFINSITEFSYSSFWWYLDFISSPSKVLNRKLRKILHNEKESRMYFSSISSEEFVAHAQKYIESLFDQIVGEETQYIIMDQAVSAQNCLQEKIFVPNSKVIIVDRDPRDIYADLMKDGNLIGKDLRDSHDTDKYIRWHRALRRTLPEVKDSRDVLYIRFEDLVLKYDDMEKTIESFLGLEHSDHVKRRQLFNPDVSSKNVGMWRNKLNNDEIEKLQLELREDLIQ